MKMKDKYFLKEHIDLIKNLSSGNVQEELNKQKDELSKYLGRDKKAQPSFYKLKQVLKQRG